MTYRGITPKAIQADVLARIEAAGAAGNPNEVLSEQDIHAGWTEIERIRDYARSRGSMGKIVSERLQLLLNVIGERPTIKEEVLTRIFNNLHSGAPQSAADLEEGWTEIDRLKTYYEHCGYLSTTLAKRLNSLISAIGERRRRRLTVLHDDDSDEEAQPVQMVDDPEALLRKGRKMKREQEVQQQIQQIKENNPEATMDMLPDPEVMMREARRRRREA